MLSDDILADEFKALRIKTINPETGKSYTQTDFGNLFDLKRPVVMSYENGKSAINQGIQNRIRAKFNSKEIGKQTVTNSNNVTNLEDQKTDTKNMEPDSMLDKMLEINKIYADNQRVFADAHIVFARAHEKAIETNAVLAHMTKEKQTTVNELQESQQGDAAMLKVLQELIVEVGVGKTWHSAAEGMAKVHKLVSGALEKGKSKDIQNNLGSKHR